MRDLPDLLTQAGLRVTPQRLVLLELLAEGGHLTADDLYRRARARLPALSATSIYKSLRALERAGLVREVALEAGAMRYDANVRPHHHRVCRACGRVEDVPCQSGGADACVHPHDLGGFLADAVDLTYRGRCVDCQARRAGSATATEGER